MKHLLVMSAVLGLAFYRGMILGILYKNVPENVKLLLIDPKSVELSCFDGIPHLLAPTICDPYSALGALDWSAAETAKRSQLFARKGVNNLESYNRIKHPNDPKVSHIIIVITHLRLLYQSVAKEKVDALIDELVHDGDSAGIHLILTSGFLPPSEFCTETIRENIPSRLIFKVKTPQDSRILLGTDGAERIRIFEALYRSGNLSQPALVHFPSFQDAESAHNDVERVVNYLRSNNSYDIAEELVPEFCNRGAIIKARVDADRTETICKQLSEAAEFFQKMLTDLSIGGPTIDMDTFSQFCDYVKRTYRAFYEEHTKEVLISALPSFRSLIQLSEADGQCHNFEFEVIRRFAVMTTCAIEEIGGGFTQWNRIFALTYPSLWYDLDNDSPEAIYDRIKSSLMEEHRDRGASNISK